MSRNTKIISVLVLVAVLLGVAVYMAFTGKIGGSDPITVVEDEPSQTSVTSGDISFEDLPDYKAVKTSGDNGATFTFYYKDKALGKAELGKEWIVDSFLSFDNGNEYFGFTYDDPSNDDKYYTGPSILYRTNGETGIFEKVIDLSENKQYISDVSEAEDQVVYANPSVAKKIYVANLSTKQVKEIGVDESLFDFGDGVLSEDSSKVAYATLKRGDGQGGVITFSEAAIMIADVATGATSVSEVNQVPGNYRLYSWQGEDIESEYEGEGNE